MNITSFLRFTGYCLFITGILFLLAVIGYSTSSDEFGSVVTMAGMILLVFGFTGMYLRQIETAGKFSFIVFVITMIGSVLWAGFMWVGTFVVPVLQDRAPELVKGDPPGLVNTGMWISMLTFFIGLFLFSIVTVSKGILPRWAAIFLVLVPILNFIPYAEIASQPLAGIAFIWMGISLAKGKIESNAE